MQGLLAERSIWCVWTAGLEALGYPPNWARDSNEVKKIQEKLDDPSFVPF